MKRVESTGTNQHEDSLPGEASSPGCPLESRKRPRLVALVVLIATLGAGSTAWSQTAYPVLDPRYTFAAERNRGETRHGTVGVAHSGQVTTQTDYACGAVLAEGCALRFQYAFRAASAEEWVVLFFTLGRTAIETVLPTGSAGPPIVLNDDSTFNFNSLMKNAADAGVSIDAIRLVLKPVGSPANLTIRLEVKDGLGHTSKATAPVVWSGANPIVVTVPIASLLGAADRTRVKQLGVVIEENHFGDNIHNPQAAGFDITALELIDQDGPRLDAATLALLPDRDLAEQVARRDFEALLRLVDARTGLSLDRTLFRDLLHTGATGSLLAALPGAVGRGWISANDAKDIGRRILRFLSNDALYHNGRTCAVGSSFGLLYRFLGPDAAGLAGACWATRKLDLGDPRKWVEASPIDTALLHWGAATFAAGFPDDAEIVALTNTLLRRTRWSDLLDPSTGRFVLGWKPELDDLAPGCFAAPAPMGGYFSSAEASDGTCPTGADAVVLTIDYRTQEGELVSILAAGSDTFPTGAGPFYRMIRAPATTVPPVVPTWPGAWFTHCAWSCTYGDPARGPDRLGLDASQSAANAFLFYMADPGDGLCDAAEHPNLHYLAQGKPGPAVDAAATCLGTQTPYSYGMAMGLTNSPDVRSAALERIQQTLVEQPWAWDPLLGFLDAFHTDLAGFADRAGASGLLRTAGPWANNQVFPLDKGFALLGMLNDLDDGIVWKTALRHPFVQRGLAAIFAPSPKLTVSVVGSGAGTVTSDDSTIGCPGDCQESYPLEGTRTLTATAGGGSTFTGWGGACTGTGSCAVAMDQDRNVTATFALNGRDLVVSAVSDPVALASPGTTYVVTDSTMNRGAATATDSMTRFYLSLDTVKSGGDVRLSGARAVPSLTAGSGSTGSTSVTIPASLAPGVYRQLACADDARLVAESDESNNCAAAAGTIQILRPDLVVTSVSDPPVVVAPGSTFAVTDTVHNPSTISAAASAARYYLSRDAAKDADDVRLAGTRNVPILAAGAGSAGTRLVTVPTGTPLETYRLLACADDIKKVAETNEANNCSASAGSVLVALPDLVTTQVSGPPAETVPGGKFTLSDTVLNQGQGPAATTTTRYYLSVDAAWNAGDALLSGTRSAVALAPGGTSAGSRVVTVPATTPAGTYYALACADGMKKVAESNEGNNCVASTATITVEPSDATAAETRRIDDEVRMGSLRGILKRTARPLSTAPR